MYDPSLIFHLTYFISHCFTEYFLLDYTCILEHSSLLAVIGVHELLKTGQLYISRTFAAFPVYIAVALMYLILTIVISRIVAYSERRLGVSDRS